MNRKKLLSAALLAASLWIAPMSAPAALALPNPYIEYPDVPSLERAIGFPVFYLPSNLYAAYHPAVHAFSINGQVADLRFVNKLDQSTLALRTAIRPYIGTDDISGFYSVDWQEQDAGDLRHTPINVAVTADGTRVVRWVSGNFAFSLAVSDIDEERFKNLMRQFVAVGERFAHKYRTLNFVLNPAKGKPKPQQPTEQAAASQQPAPQK